MAELRKLPSALTARTVLDQGQALLDEGEWVAATLDDAQAAVVDAHRALAWPHVRARVDALPIDRLQSVTAGHLRMAALPDAGFTTVGAVLDADRAALAAVPGVGAGMANSLQEAAQALAHRIADDIQVPLEHGDDDTALVVALERLARLREAARSLRGLTDQVVPALRADLPAAEAVTSRSGLLFGGREHKDAATAAYWRVDQAAAWASERGVHDRVSHVHEQADAPLDPDAGWAFFDDDPADAYALLGDVVGMRVDQAGTTGLLPADVAARVASTTLETNALHGELREYQRFGARYLLAQRRAILGDADGLGKTVTALAGLAHLRAQGSNRFLIVTPASLVGHWRRAVAEFIGAEAFALFGPDAERAVRSWLVRGGFGIATFDSATVDLLADVDLDALVVDEAHQLKSPASTRAILTAALGRRAQRVWFLTGVPFDERPADFVGLVSSLEPEGVDLETLAGRVGRGDRVAPTFAADMAPLYLRREAADVNIELPPLIQVDQWCGFNGADEVAYSEAVKLGNFSSMRKAAFISPDPAESAKIERLLELIDDLQRGGEKVVIFSGFFTVLNEAAKALKAAGVTTAGPLTSSVPEPERQPLVDRFAASGQSDVLLVHLQPEGLDVTIGGSPVVVVAEPQIMPSLELQAIGRCRPARRRGSLTVHRLLTEHAVDEQMLAILGHKRVLADGLANDAAEAPVAGVSEVVVAQEIIPVERERLNHEGLHGAH